MNFITPLLFVFYLQVMPPPPPTMHGGGDYWAGQTVNSDGVVTDTWDEGTLLGAFFRDRDAIAALGGNRNLRQIINAIRAKTLINLTEGEWNGLFLWEIFDFFGPSKQDICDAALEYGGEAGYNSAVDNDCTIPVPLPKELLFLSILSFLLIYYYHNREEFSNLTLFKRSCE